MSYFSNPNGSIGGIPGIPNCPVAKAGCKNLTLLMIQSAKFLSFREQTLMVGALRDNNEYVFFLIYSIVIRTGCTHATFHLRDVQ